MVFIFNLRPHFPARQKTDQTVNGADDEETENKIDECIAGGMGSAVDASENIHCINQSCKQDDPADKCRRKEKYSGAFEPGKFHGMMF